MKTTIMAISAALLVAGTASAETFTLYDNGGGNAYGDVTGYFVDIDTTYNAFYDTPLVAGQQYTLDSISVYQAAATNTTPLYLHAWASSSVSFSGDSSANYLGASVNAVDMSAGAVGNQVTWNFSGITVTAGNDGWLGVGSLSLFFDDNSTRNNFGPSGGIAPTFRLDAGADASTLGSAIYAFGAIQGSRTPEITVNLTAVPVPEPSALALVAVFGAGFLVVRRRSRK